MEKEIRVHQIFDGIGSIETGENHMSNSLEKAEEMMEPIISIKRCNLMITNDSEMEI